jgi:3-oxoacyl-[acyl-carrier-protein] synthase II
MAAARIAAGQGDIALVGGAYNAERPDILLHYEMGGHLWKRAYVPVAARGRDGGGMVLGSVACFLVLESRAHADARGAAALARLRRVRTDRGQRAAGAARANAERQWADLDPDTAAPGLAVLSGASGLAAVTQEEMAFLADLRVPWRMTGTALGHSMEPSVIANIGLATIALSHGRLFGPLDATEAPADAPLRQVVVTGWGHWRGEAMALLDREEG